MMGATMSKGRALGACVLALLLLGVTPTSADNACRLCEGRTFSITVNSAVGVPDPSCPIVCRHLGPVRLISPAPVLPLALPTADWLPGEAVRVSEYDDWLLVPPDGALLGSEPTGSVTDTRCWRDLLDCVTLRGKRAMERVPSALAQWVRAAAPHAMGSDEWMVRGASVPWTYGERIAPAMAMPMVCGYVPTASCRVTFPSEAIPIPELFDVLAREAELEVALECDASLADTVVQVTAESGRVDEILLGLALAVGGEWRAFPRNWFLAGSPRVLQEHLLSADLLESVLGYHPRPPSDVTNAIVPLDESSFPSVPDVVAVAANWHVGDAGGRLVAVRWDRSQATLHAMPPLTHCASDSILGFAEGRGAPLDKASKDTLVAATENKGDLDGNELIALAKSVGVELVGVKGTLDEIGEKQGVAILHLDWGHYVAVTDCDSAFVTLLGADGRRARFPKDALESGMSGVMFVSPELLGEGQTEAGEQ